MSAAKIVRAVPAGPDSSPNTTAPPFGSTFQLAIPQAGYAPTIWMSAVGGGCTVQLWALEPMTGRWLSVGSAVALTADVMGFVVATGVGSVAPTGCDLFLQVTVIGTATKIAAGVL
jgi:hypothetical protein